MKRLVDTGRGLLIAMMLGGFIAPVIAQEQPPAGAKSGGLAPMQPKQFPVGVQWVLVTLNGKSVGLNQPTLQLDAQLRMRGFGGCNTFSAVAYPLKNQGLAVGPIALTRKECAKTEMDLEKAYLLGLRTAGKWEEREGSLFLVGQAGELKFERALF
jgi:heat shock protein HslJ